MSYILDALRKADAQRERDPARGIHAQPVRLAIGEGRMQSRYRTGFWAAGAAGLAVLASVGWYLFQDRAAATVAPPAARVEIAAPTAPAIAVAPVMPPAAAVTPPAAAVLPPPVAAPPVAVAPPAAVAPPVAPASASGQGEASPRVSAKIAPAAQNAKASPAVPQRAASAPAPAQAAVSAPAQAPAPPIAEAPPMAGLPADAPKLAISGGVYSVSAAQRMLIVNGQVFNEGGEVGPGVVLEEIRPKAAVLRFRGSRYSVAY